MALILALLGLYLLLPWACLWGFGPAAAIAGAVASHGLYLATLKPSGSLCLGLPWPLVLANSVAAVVVGVVVLLSRVG